MPLPIEADEENAVAELDFGNTPPGMLVVREVRWPRVVGVVICLVVGSLFSLPVLLFEAKPGELPFVFMFAAISTFLAGCGVWLFAQLLNANCFYLALGEESLYRRRGPRRLNRIPIRDIHGFESRKGVLRVSHGRPVRRTMLLKDAYAPERLSTIAERLGAWITSPPTERLARMDTIDLRDVHARRRLGNKVLLTGLVTISVIPMLIAWRLAGVQQPNAFQAIRTVVAVGAVISGIGQVIAGAIIRWQARPVRHRLESM